MPKQEFFPMPQQNKDALIAEYRHLKLSKAKMHPAQIPHIFQRLAALQEIIEKEDIAKIDMELKNAKTQ